MEHTFVEVSILNFQKMIYISGKMTTSEFPPSLVFKNSNKLKRVQIK